MQTVIHATTLYDGKSVYKDKYITIENDKITSVSDEKQSADFTGIVTPAFIDAHSHIGMDRQGEPDSEGESNDYGDQILPLLNPVNSIYFDDRAFEEAVDFGVLYSCVIPGSGNVLGGKAVIIKNFAQNRSTGVLKDYGYKMALGYNPRSTTDWHGTRPNTRMGVYALLEEKFDAVLQKKTKLEIEYQQDMADVDKEKPDAEQQKNLIQKKFDGMLEWSSEEKALLELLEGKKVAKVHVHKEDDALYLAELVRKYHIKATADHTSDFTHTEVYNILAEAGIKVCYGPCGSFDYKVELKHSHYGNVKYLMQSNAVYGLISDHPVTLSANLKDSLKYFLYQGMTQADAINLITSRNAQILEIDDILGTIEAGKLASLIIWNKDPFNLASFPRVVMAEGKILRKVK